MTDTIYLRGSEDTKVTRLEKCGHKKIKIIGRRKKNKNAEIYHTIQANAHSDNMGGFLLTIILLKTIPFRIIETLKDPNKLPVHSLSPWCGVL